MTIEHRNIEDPEIHEIKGAASAPSNTVPVADGNGSHVWTPASQLVDPTNFSIQRVLEASNFSDQALPDVDVVYRVDFGPTVNTVNDPINLDANSVIHINEPGLYHVKIRVQYGKPPGGTSTTLFHFRPMLNGNQLGSPISANALVDDNRTLEVNSWLYLSAADQLVYEVLLDSTEAGNGVLHSITPSSIAFPQSPSTYLQIDRFIKVGV